MRYCVITHLGTEYREAASPEQAEGYVWRAFAARGCDPTLRNGWRVVPCAGKPAPKRPEVKMPGPRGVCAMCPSIVACKRMFGSYWRDKSDNGRGCASPIDISNEEFYTPARLAQWKAEQEREERRKALEEMI